MDEKPWASAQTTSQLEKPLTTISDHPKERNMATAKKRKPAAKSAAKKAPAKKAPARKSAGKSSNGKRSGGSDYTTYSGKFTVRLPRSLHQALVDRAEKEGVSLNLFVTNALSRTVAGAGGKKK
jgi:predicted HicB family RNase H-like nuclease